MAYANKIISNPVTGQQIKFKQTAGDTSGKLLELESTYQPHSAEPAMHYHPTQSEYFEILSGVMNVRIGGHVKRYHPGEALHIPANIIHSMWNAGETAAVVNWKVVPALDTEYFFEDVMGLAADGKTNDKGMPKLLQYALFATRYAKVFRLAKPPLIVQHILFAILKPFALLAGYRSSYKNYFD